MLLSPGLRSGTCPRGCSDEVQPTIEPIDAPNTWVRYGVDGRWFFSNCAPMPTEAASSLSYQCPTCRLTMRVVDGTPAEIRLAC